MSPSSVAEKRSVWCSPFTRVRMRSTCGRKPMSAIWSASSRTTICDVGACATSPRSRRSFRRPGVAMTMSTPHAEHAGLRVRARRRRRWRAMRRPRARASGSIASSDLGREFARRDEDDGVGKPGLAALRRSIIGRPKASVLPEPVRALPQTSTPESASAIVSAWIGVGAVIPLRARMSAMSWSTPSGGKSECGAGGSGAWRCSCRGSWAKRAGPRRSWLGR